MSKEEDMFAEKMDVIFAKWNTIRNWRPNKLKNNKTGKNLEIDYYIGKYAIGFEYQGGVHFKDIKVFGNNSDKSRHHDMLKYELIEDEKHKKRRPLTIVEMFEVDLIGNFRSNLIVRLNNSIAFYSDRHWYTHAISLMKLLCFVECGVKFKHENIIDGSVPVKYCEAIDHLNRLKNIYNG